METFNIELFTPSGKVFSELTTSVKIPAVDGEIQILPKHVGYVGVLGTGLLEYTNAKGLSARLAISGGFVSFLNNTLSVLTDQAVLSDQVDPNYAEQRGNLLALLKSSAYDTPEAQRSRDQLSFISALDQLVSN